MVGAGLGTGALGVGLGLGMGWFYSSALLDARRQRVYPERVLAADGSTVTLNRSRLTVQPGVWGLRWPDGLARIGPVVESGATTVVRQLLAGPLPPPGTAAVLDAGPYDPDPAARHVPFSTVLIHTPLGPAPAWLVPAAGPDWAVLVHGRGGGRRESLRILPALRHSGLSTLVITYRNDGEAPASPDGHYHLGDTEWLDVEAAVRYARSCGARRIVLFGWSMGAAVTGAFLDRSAAAPEVAAVIWDAPLVDWRATLRQQARNRRLPGRLAAIATFLTSRRIGIDFDHFDLRAHPPAVRPPTLIIHSSADTAVPVAPTRALVAAATGLNWPMQYLEVPDVDHTGSWNAGPDRYERVVTEFLAAQLGEGAADS